VRGKPWTPEEENRLRQMLQANRSIRVIARTLGKTRDCVRMKVARLGLEVVVQEQKNSPRTTTTCLSSLVLPSELPSIEEQLKILAAAVETLRSGQVEKLDVMRLRTVIQGVRVYQELLADYVDYRGIEAKVAELEEKYAKLLEDKAKDNSSKPVSAPVETSPAQ
jgi:hypothetical protein